MAVAPVRAVQTRYRRRRRLRGLPAAVAVDGPHALRDGYYNPSTPNADQTAGFMQLMADAANGIGYLDGKLGWVVDAQALAAAPACQTLVLQGINKRRGPAYLQGGSRIIVNNDLPFGTPPDLTPIVDLRNVARPSWIGIPIVRGKPTFPTKGGGIIPSRIGGLGLPGSYRVEDTSIGGVSSPFVGGRAKDATHQATGVDHSDMVNVATDSCGCSFHMVPGGNTSGDQIFEDCDFGGSRAAFLMAHSASSGLVGDSFLRVGSYAPLSFVVYDDGSGASGGQLGSDVLTSFSGEFNYNGIYYDQLWNRQGGSFVGADTWSPGFYQSPSSDLLGWGHVMTVLSNSGTTLVVEVPPGFQFQYGMHVKDPASLDPTHPALATVLSIDEPWPYAPSDKGPFQATLHLDEAIPQQAGAQVHVGIPKLGTIVAGSISFQKIEGGLMRDPTGKPVFVAGRSNVHDVMIEDWQSAKALEAVAPVFGGHVGTGNFAGYEGNSVRIGWGVMGAGMAAGHGEFVCGWMQTNLQRYNGSAPALGVVIRNAGVGPLEAVGYQRKASDRNTTAPCINHTDAEIAGFSFVKPDPDTGGILPCVSDDSAAVGIVGKDPVAAGAVGVLQALWCDKLT